METRFKNLYIRADSFGILPLLFLGAFFIRLLKVFQEGVIAHDGIVYIQMAKILSQGQYQRMMEYSYFNLYPALIALAQPIFRDWELSGRMVSVLFGSLTVVPLFLIIRKLVNGKVAIVASFFYMIGPHFARYSSDVLREPTFWFFSITGLWLAWEGISKGRWHLFALSSIFSGLAVFTRIEGLAIFLVITLWIIWYFRKEAGKVVIFLIILTLSFPVIIFPSLYHLKNRLGRWELGQVGGYVRNLPSFIHSTEQTLAVKPEVLNQTTIQFRGFIEISKRHRWATFFSEVVYKFIKSFHIVLFILLFFGIFKRNAIPYSKKEIAGLLWFATFFLISFFYMTKNYYFSTRHGLLMGFPALIWSGIGFYELKERLWIWLSKESIFLSIPKFVTIFLLFIIAGCLLPKTILSYREEKVGLKRIGIYLKEAGYSKSKIVGQPELIRVAFYAESEFLPLPYGLSFEEMMKFAKENEATLLAVNEKTITSYSNHLVQAAHLEREEKIPIPQWGKEKRNLAPIFIYSVK